MSVTVPGPGVAYFDMMQGQFKSHLQQNLRIRVSHMPKISIETNERQLVFASNAKANLAAFDRNYVATRLVERVKSA